MIDLKKKRAEFVEYVKGQLIGGYPIKDNKLDGIAPRDLFFTGLLAPIGHEEMIDESKEENEASSQDTEKSSGQAVRKNIRYMPPSSAGFSFFITGEDIKLRVVYQAVAYKEEEKTEEEKSQSRKWQRHILGDNGEVQEVELTVNGQDKYDVFDGKAEINSLWRPHKNGYIVTISLSNTQLIDANDGRKFNKEINEKTLFEVEFSCIVESGNIAEYPSTDRSLLSDEEKAIQLRYQDLKIYAVGHGTAANWKENKQGKMKVWADFMPQVEVPRVTADTSGDQNDNVLQFHFLQKLLEGDNDVIDKLKLFVMAYEEWIEEQRQEARAEEDQETAQKLIEELTTAHNRMQGAIELLRENEKARIAFATMNEAMLKQWKQGDINKGILQQDSSYKWRPFQLGFILMTLQSSIDENDEFRDTLELIWFPTGGGKTEAYLGLMAFLFLYRRLQSTASGAGTVAIMRYTLRLLTTQQFVRANKVICALELIRQQKSNQFGKEPFSSGLWVGKATAPNTYKKACKYLEREELDRLVIRQCPWCDDEFKKKNYQAGENYFNFLCTNTHCDFGKLGEALPCNIVDEMLYKSPPTLLIGTVDKFARLAWEERAGSFFGEKSNKPPELIIQDELHLISDALGSIVGLYEAGIETAIISRYGRPKYIASTATIKNAAQQVERLFAKEMKLFPPSGLRYDNSYFAKTVPLDKEPGRLYVGYLAPLLNRSNCLTPLASTLLSAPTHLFKNGDDKVLYMDRWWTGIIYHGSLKGLANSSTLYQNRIRTRLEELTVRHLKEEIDNISPNFCEEKNLKNSEDFNKTLVPEEIKQIINQYLPARELTIEQLSSKNLAEKNNEIFNALAKQKGNSEAIDVAVATNMVATGLDVSRLALMVINGQPLTTAEYIQASSRVGRGETPGIVFTNYYKTQARSLSHYENFRSYHDSFYRFVEPCSVTPFTYQARKRALHAALVIAIRHGGVGLLENNTAGDFDKGNPEIQQLIQRFKKRCNAAIDSEKNKQDTVENINQLVDDWDNEKQSCQEKSIKMVYYESDRSSSNLICNFDIGIDEKKGLWETLQSMRNVENSAMIKLIPGLKKRDE